MAMVTVLAMRVITPRQLPTQISWIPMAMAWEMLLTAMMTMTPSSMRWITARSQSMPISWTVTAMAQAMSVMHFPQIPRNQKIVMVMALAMRIRITAR